MGEEAVSTVKGEYQVADYIYMNYTYSSRAIMTIHEVIATPKANLKQTDITLYAGANESIIKQSGSLAR
jgi:hypothetical protein